MSAREGMLQTELDSVKQAAAMQRSQFLNTLIEIKEHAQAGDYDAIIELLEPYTD